MWRTHSPGYKVSQNIWNMCFKACDSAWNRWVAWWLGTYERSYTVCAGCLRVCLYLSPVSLLTPLEPQSCFGGKLLEIWVVCTHILDCGSNHRMSGSIMVEKIWLYVLGTKNGIMSRTRLEGSLNVILSYVATCLECSLDIIPSMKSIPELSYSCRCSCLRASWCCSTRL